jgi:hypothetical protein
VLLQSIPQEQLGGADHVLEPDVSSSVDVEIDARDRGIPSFERSKGTDVVLGDGDHGTS